MLTLSSEVEQMRPAQQEYRPVTTPLNRVSLSMGAVDPHKTAADQEPPPEPKPKANKILFLDGVRGLAAFFVVLQHADYAGEVNLGAAGVDIFFVLSAFLLTMIMDRKCRQLLQQQASARAWGLAMTDYFMKRFLRVYPLFAVSAVVLALLPDHLQDRYFLTHAHGSFNLFKVLTFQTNWRYHVYWTLPLEIMYYFCIPVFVLIVISLRKLWWVAFLPTYGWIVYQGLKDFRTDHMPLLPHLPTFLSGSLAAIVFLKTDSAMKERSIKLRPWHKMAIKVLECAVLGLIFSVCTKGAYFDWFFTNPVPEGPGGFRFISVLVTIVLVLEMLSPGEISQAFEWSVLRFWGKISFSVYLLHSFVIYTPAIRSQQRSTDRFLSEIVLIIALATVSYYLVEYPSQLLAARIGKALAACKLQAPAPATQTADVSVDAPTDTGIIESQYRYRGHNSNCDERV